MAPTWTASSTHKMITVKTYGSALDGAPFAVLPWLTKAESRKTTAPAAGWIQAHALGHEVVVGDTEMDRNARVTRQGDRAVPGDADHGEQDHSTNDECRCHRSTCREHFITISVSSAAGRSQRSPGPANGDGIESPNAPRRGGSAESKGIPFAVG
jgi:hypothetical protein